MKPDKKCRNDPKGNGFGAAPASSDSPPFSNRRRWLFRLAALTLIPVLLLVALELGLRVGGYGYSTSFFIKTRIQSRDVFVENGKFGLRFFPPTLARSPAPLVMPAQKPEHTYRIFILGESAALGDPKPAYGFGRYLGVLLRERFPDTRFEVVCTATTAINSHAILPIARECARHEGDLWIVYMGNNEMEGPFGAGTVFGPKAPSMEFIRALRALKTTRLGQLLDALGRRLLAGSDPKSWGGFKMFLEHQVGPNDPGRNIVHEHFRRNLEEIARVGQKAGVEVLLATIACNLKDCAPFASLHGTSLTEAQRRAWETNYGEGIQFELAGNFREALRLFGQAAKLDPSFADLQFRIGRCQLVTTNLEAASAAFERAGDFDALPFRADSRINEIIRTAASQFADRGVDLVDVARMLALDSPQQIPGEEWFYEHVHFNFEGNYQLALIMARQVESLLPEEIAKQRRNNWASPEACARRLGLTDWNRYQVYESMLLRVSDAPFTNQLNHLVRRNKYKQKLLYLKSLMTSDARKAAREIYQEALVSAPEDHFLHENFAEFLEMTGDTAEAAKQWQQVSQLLPHHPVAYFQAGKLLSRQGQFEEAEQSLSRALNIMPDWIEALLELSELLVKAGKAEEATARCAQALRLQPENAKAHYYLANTLGAQSKRSEAMESLREAIRLQPNFWEARYLLGLELALQDKIQEAQMHFAEVVRLRPDYSLAHLNLGVALAKQGRINEALVQFQETLRLDPQNKAAQQHLETLRSLIDRARQ